MRVPNVSLPASGIRFCAPGARVVDVPAVSVICDHIMRILGRQAPQTGAPRFPAQVASERARVQSHDPLDLVLQAGPSQMQVCAGQEARHQVRVRPAKAVGELPCQVPDLCFLPGNRGPGVVPAHPVGGIQLAADLARGRTDAAQDLSVVCSELVCPHPVAQPLQPLDANERIWRWNPSAGDRHGVHCSPRPLTWACTGSRGPGAARPDPGSRCGSDRWHSSRSPCPRRDGFLRRR
jgi:hypothetical protein